MKFKEILRPEEVAKRLGITEETLLDSWRRLGMPVTKIGKNLYIIEGDFLRWFESMGKPQNAQDAPGEDFFGTRLSTHAPQKS